MRETFRLTMSMMAIIGLLCAQSPGQILSAIIQSGPVTWVDPTFVASANNFSSSSTTVMTSSALTITSGDIVAFYCRGGNNASFTASSSPSNTIASLPLRQPSPAGSGQMFYVLGAVSGSTTFTCTQSISSAFQGISVVQYHPGSITAEDSTNSFSQIGASSGSFTSSSFSTSSRGLVILCADASFASGNFTAGLIGGVSSTLRTTASWFPPCEDRITTTSLSSVTAAVSTATGSGTWTGAVLIFK